MIQIPEANLSQAMDYTYNNFIKSHDTDNLLAYRPVTQKDEWLVDNPMTGIIYLKKHPNLKAAWVLVKFEQKTFKTYGTHTVAKNNVKIDSIEEFEKFFGVKPGPDFDFTSDMTIIVRWDKENIRNLRPNRDFDETTPNFYMYTNHLKTNIDQLIKRLYRIDEIVETNPKAIVGNQFNLPYSATNI